MRILTVVTAAAISLSATTALAEGVGEAMAVIDAASASGQVGERILAVGSKVFVGDLVTTNFDGRAQLLFDDGTRMVVGPNSSLVVAELRFGGNATENRFTIDALGGTFRFISGESGDRGYSIRTPSATISMSGTAFDFAVTPSGGTKLVLLQGEVTLCGKGGDCVTVAAQCGLLQTDTGQDVEEIEVGNRWVEETREHFPYLMSQSSLLEGFRIDGLGCLLLRPVGTVGLVDFALDRSGIQSPEPGIGAGVGASGGDPGPVAGKPPGDGNNGGGNGDTNSNTGQAGLAEGDPSNPAHGGGAAGASASGSGGSGGSGSGGSGGSGSGGNGAGSGGGKGGGHGGGGGKGGGKGGGGGGGGGNGGGKK